MRWPSRRSRSAGQLAVVRHHVSAPLDQVSPPWRDRIDLGLERAIQVLDDVDALLGDKSQIARGHALCRRAEVQWRVGRVEEAHETLARAREVAAVLGLSTETPLSRELRATAALLSDA